MIFTYMWAFDRQDDWDYVNCVEELFVSKGAEVYYVELEVEYGLHIERNKTENRLLNKPTKRDLYKSEALFRNLETKYRLNSYEGEITKTEYIKINNTDLLPEKVALIIKNKFSL